MSKTTNDEQMRKEMILQGILMGYKEHKLERDTRLVYPK